MRIVIILLASLLSFASLCMAAPVGAPYAKLNKSKYIVTTDASFMLSRGTGATYNLNYELRKTFPQEIYGLVTFDNPASPGAPFEVEVTVPAGETQIYVQSPGIHLLQNNHSYQVVLTLYDDATHTQSLSEHKQAVVFSYSARQLAELEEKFDLQITL